MKIASSLVQISSQRQYVQRAEREERMRAWIGDRPPDRDTVAIAPAPQIVDDLDIEEQDMDDALTPELRMLRLLLEKVFGVKVKLQTGSHERECDERKNPESTPSEARGRQGWGMEYDLRESYYEAEQTAFSAGGIVKTSDGQAIRFTLNLAMSREYATEHHVSIRAGDAVDPLVIHFDGTAAQLSDVRFSFDIDADGQAEQIASTAGGSGFLALDLDGNGKVTNGSELFGPTTGDGFAELAGHDLDGNGWIDEDDAVYDQLRVWRDQANEAGGTLSSLKASNVGAIYLGRESTPFTVKNGANETLGQVVSSSVFLGDDGSAGSVQQINLTI